MKYTHIKNSDKKIQIGKLVCVGRNYAAHAKELGNEIPSEPMLFLKTATCIVDSGQPVFHPEWSDNLHHEVELVLLIGETVKNADDETAERSIIGYAVGLDMTLRDLQNKFRSEGNPWTLAKVFDTSAVLSEFVLKSDYRLTLNEKIWLNINGKKQQESLLSNMIFSPVELVKFISSRMTLEEGDLIFTGTPDGVSKVIRGDRIESGIENIATLSTQIR
ncbi:MAG: fumarylacetoacetate hydrolase family protein [Melioribacteraceae bacterium]|nr:fumarylacetoacetate hydrolase family protein [Melioribacteraceae bacterium]